MELQFYELWRHEGRRARMGAMMMAPDYARWHGFYEVKSRFNEFMEEADHLIETGKKAYVYPKYPNATGDTIRPPKIFGKSSNDQTNQKILSPLCPGRGFYLKKGLTDAMDGRSRGGP